ncbi:MAG: protease [Bacteroidia bacterium]|nr:protease [Bacteroidia bacterium]
MKKLLSLTAFAAVLLFAVQSCKKENQAPSSDEISQDVLTQIRNHGFSTDNVLKDEGGYVVEGDIFIPDGDLLKQPGWNTLNVANSEQYRTTNLVTGLPRNITVSVANNLPSSYVTATNEAIARYNALGLTITFSRVSGNNANIRITKAPFYAQYLASAGFPTSNGNPYNSIKVNSTYLGSNPGTNYLATILAHEMGHCIGFRHTDYMDRSYSCGGSYYNEGSAGVGAIHIPGTPTGPDANSWMLSCIGSGVNRPFNSNDQTALNYLY